MYWLGSKIGCYKTVTAEALGYVVLCKNLSSCLFDDGYTALMSERVPRDAVMMGGYDAESDRTFFKKFKARRKDGRFGALRIAMKDVELLQAATSHDVRNGHLRQFYKTGFFSLERSRRQRLPASESVHKVDFPTIETSVLFADVEVMGIWLDADDSGCWPHLKAPERVIAQEGA